LDDENAKTDGTFLAKINGFDHDHRTMAEKSEAINHLDLALTESLARRSA
jgi:hypothetical protein